MGAQQSKCLTTEWLTRCAARHPERAALVEKDGVTTYSQLRESVLSHADGIESDAGPLLVSESGFISCMTRLLAAWERGRCVALVPPTILENERRALVQFIGETRVPDGIGLMLFTSGTTGVPKAACLSAQATCESASLAAERIGLVPADRLCVGTPPYFTSGLCHFLSALSRGATVVSHQGFAFGSELVSFLAKMNCTAFGGAPTHLVRVADTVAGNALPKALRVWMSSGDHLPVATLRKAKATYPHLRVVPMYGLTEVGGRLCVADESTPEGSVGRSLGDMRITVRRADGTEAAAGETGEFFVTGPYLMRGYLGDSPLSEIGHASGDFGFIDERGDAWLEGRRDDLFKCGGERISAMRVRDALIATGLCADVAVLGVVDNLLGQIPVAFVVPKSASEEAESGWDRKRARELLSQTLPASHLPRAWHLVDSIPRTGSGKVRRAELLAKQREEERR